MRTSLCALVLLLFSVAAQAQSPIIIGPNSLLAWDVLTPDLATAQSLSFTAVVDTGATRVLNGVTCVASPTAGMQTCSAPIAQIPTGSHTITVAAVSGSVTSAPSAPLTYVDLLIPVPSNLRIK